MRISTARMPTITSSGLISLLEDAAHVSTSCFDTSETDYDPDINRSPIARAYGQILDTMVAGLNDLPDYYFHDPMMEDCTWAAKLVFEHPTCLNSIDYYGWPHGQFKDALRKALNDHSLDSASCRQIITPKPLCEAKECVFDQVGKQVEVSEECIDSSEILGFKGTVDMKKLFDTDKRNCRVLSAGISDLGFCEVGAFHCSEELNETNNFVVRPLWIGWGKTKQSLRSVIEGDAEQIDLLKLVSRFPCPHVTC